MSRSTVGCIVTLTLSILAMALAATAQPAGKVPRIGWLTTGVRPAGPHPLLEVFRQGLRRQLTVLFCGHCELVERLVQCLPGVPYSLHEHTTD